MKFKRVVRLRLNVYSDNFKTSFVQPHPRASGAAKQIKCA